MKKRLVMTLLALGMTLGACGTQEAPAELPTQEETPTREETPTQEEVSVQEEQSTQTETTTETPVNVEETVPVVSSGDAQNLTQNIETISAPKAEITDAQKEALSRASMQLFANAVKQEGEHPNVLLSPTSIQLAFGMTENGAKGDTLAQIEQVINGGVAIDEMNPLLYNLSERFQSAQEVEWNVANSIWFKDDGLLRVKDEFAQKALSWYGADIWMAPFDSTTVTDINSWVNDQTKGMIPGILDEIPAEARMYLINAMAFEGEWMEEYEERDIMEDCSFTNADGSQTDVTMLASSENRYFTLGEGCGFLRDYKGGEYSFMGLLPEEGTDLDDYIASLADSNADLAAAIQNAQYGTVIVNIPEFTDDYDIQMKDMLMAMGMENAFDPAGADFTDMMKPVTADEWMIWIGDVLHKTHIEVDRAGTRAAAVTAIEMRAAGCAPIQEEPIRIILDRPFIYGIIDNATGLPIFLGCINTL